MRRKDFIKGGILLGGTMILKPLAATTTIKSDDEGNKRKKLWLLLSHIENPFVHLVIPVISWIAKEAGIEFECYLEAQRDGQLFARTGSTVLGGHHHQQFNYLNAVYDVEYIFLGKTTLFNSSIKTFNRPVIAQSDSPAYIYKELLAYAGIKHCGSVVFSLSNTVKNNDKDYEIAPYMYPEIFFRKALAFPALTTSETTALLKEQNVSEFYSLLISDQEKQQLKKIHGSLQEIDTLKPGEGYHDITLRIAERWKKSAKGIAFGDPAAILSQLAKLCRENRLPLYGVKNKLNPSEIIVSDYTEAFTCVADDVIRLCKETGNKVIVGRQTGDGDLFHWSKGGVCIQIMDPNRPAFPIVESIPHMWVKTGKTVFENEPDDATLEKWASEGRQLATLMWHSGEMAHNEAMLNLFDLVCFTGIKMGIGVHAARYSTCPQLWELLNVPRENGGVKHFIEPVLHSGGMGVLVESNCPVDDLKNHCREAINRINIITGGEAVPKGYYAFMDSDLKTNQQKSPDKWDAISSCGLEYIVSSAMPGRNTILHDSGNCVVINQSSQTICTGSPYVRITTVEDLNEAPNMSPGWIIGTLDAPVIAFNQYIWEHGSRFMSLVNRITKSGWINTTPHTIARYAAILKKKGYLPS